MMLRKHFYTAIVLAGLSLTAGTSDVLSQDPELLVEIEKQEIYEGESVIYQVTLNHVEKPTAPTLAGFDAFEVESLGEQSLDSRQVTIINGRRSEVIRRGRQYRYRLTPRKSGLITIPAPTARADNVSLTGREVHLRVIPPGDQDAVILEFTSDRSSVYPMQPFELMLTVAVKDLPGQLKDRDPLSVQPTPPALNIPWLSDDRLPDGIRPRKGWREILEPLMSRRGHGFQINNIGSSSVFSLFDNEATGFHPQPIRTTRTDADGTEAGYWEYRLRRKLIPQRAGTFSFGSATLKGTFADGMDNGQLTGRRVYALARGLELTVRDVPRDGRPENYIGAVGSFEITARLVPTTARVGDPMTLTLTLSGQGTLADARPPEISELPGISGAFRMYEATEESQPDSRRFTYSLRPLQTDVTEFPALSVSCFDVTDEQYVTLRTDPIPVTIEAAETLSTSEIVSSPAAADSSAALEATEGGVFANDSSLNSVQDQTVRPGRWLAIWSAMFISWGAVSLGIRHIRRIQSDPALLRRKSAPQRARDALATLNRTDAQNDSSESLMRVVSALIADYANVPEAGLTPREAAALLARLGVNESLQTTTRDLLMRCDAARYGAAAADTSSLSDEVTNLVEQLIGELRQASKHATAVTENIASILLVCSLSLAGCQSEQDLERSRKFQQVEQAFSQATSPEDFSRVARMYDQIGDQGFVSGAILYNQGNAWMRAGEIGHAIAAYRQALRYRPRDPYLQANLQNALTAAGLNAGSASPGSVARYIFFWQNWLSYPEKFVVTTVFLAGVLALLLLAQLMRTKTVYRRLAVPVGCLWLLFCASTAWDWYRFEGTIQGVVTTDQAVARKGNAESYEAAFTDPIAEGTGFTVLDVRSDWLQARFGNSGTGWLLKRDVQTY